MLDLMMTLVVPLTLRGKEISDQNHAEYGGVHNFSGFGVSSLSSL